MSGLIHEIRLALRLLRNRPAFCLLVVLTLGLGIGANTAVFTLVNAIMFRPPSVRAPRELINIYMSREDGSGYGALSHPEYRDLRAERGPFESILGYSGLMATLTADGRSEVLFGELVTGNYFPALGVQAALGRGLVPGDDEKAGASPVVVLGHGLWQRRFAADPAIVGRQVTLNGRPFTVVGVAPPDFTGLLFPGFAVDVWAPTMMMGQLRADRLEDRGERWLFVKGRLRPGMTIAAARAAAGLMASRWRAAYPEVNRGRELRLLRAADVYVNAEGDRAVIPAAAALLVAVGLVLLVACSNVSGVMLARASGLRREAAIRLSLGAGRARLLTRGLAESLVLSGLGALAGFALSALLTRLLWAYRPPLPVPIALSFAVDWRVAAYAAGLSLCTALVLGILPWWQVSRQDPTAGLRHEPLGGRRSIWGLRNLLLLPQVALSLVLLVLAGLFARSVASASAVDPGFDADKTALLTLNLGMSGYDEPRAEAFYRELLGRLAARPGVSGVALAGRVPLDLYGNQSASVTADARGPGPLVDTVQVARVGDGYFQALGIAVVRGRAFERSDSPAAQVAMVSAEAARRFWPGENPLGRRIRVGTDGPWCEVIGVAADVKVQTLGESPQPLVYQPLTAGHAGLLRVVVRHAADPAGFLPEMRRQVAALDPGVAVFECETTSRTLDVMLYPFRMAALVGSALGFFGLVLSAVGVLGVSWAGVVQRSREFGIRGALGARPAQLLALTLRDGLAMTGVGIGVGMAAAIPSALSLRGWLFGIAALDATTFVTVPTVLAGVAFVACWIPARRITIAPPAQALRD